MLISWNAERRNDAMADPALRTPDPVFKVVPRPGAERRKVSLVGVFKQYRRVILLVRAAVAGGGDWARRLPHGRALHLDRQRLRGSSKGSDHAQCRRQDQSN